MTVASPGPRRAPAWVVCAGGLAAGLSLSLVLNAIWWSLLSPAARPEDNDFVIPKGTAAAIAAGGPAPFVPDAFALREGARLIVRNEDVVEHRVGTAVVPPGSTAVIEPDDSSDGLVCTIHPSGYVGLQVTARPGLGAMVLPTLVAGLPMGIVAAVVMLVGRRLDLDGPGASAPGAAA